MPAVTDARASGSRRWTCDRHRRRYKAGCRDCQERGAERGRIRHRLIAYGTWRGMVDATAATEHVAKLVAAGWSGNRIASTANVARAVVHRLVRREATEIYPESHDAILALPISTYTPAGRDYIDSTGAARRLQALTAIGYTPGKLAAELGVAEQRVYRWRRQFRRSIAAAHHQQVAALYERLCLVPGSSATARATAAAKGWASPLAWDDDTIDDPDAQPNLGDTEVGDDFDEITVGQACEGRLTYAQIALHRPDLIETVRRLAKTLTDQEISHLLRWPGATDRRSQRSPSRATNSITKLRKDNGVPACTRPESIAPRVRTGTRAQAA